MRYKGNFNRSDIISLWEFLKHGSRDHELWLLDGIEAWFLDEQRPPERK